MLNVEFDRRFQTNLLYALLADKEFFKDVSGKLRSTDFGTDALRLLYEVADKYYKKFNQMITPEILQMEAIGAVNGTTDNYRNSVTEQDYSDFADVLCGACNALQNPSTANSAYFRDPKKLNRFVKTVRFMAADAKGLDADSYAEEINQIQTDVASMNADGFQFTDPTEFSEVFGESEYLYGTGLQSIDIPLGGGMDIGQYGILVAPSGVGKSIGMLNFALNNALMGRHSLTMTLENPESMVVSRLNAMMSFIDARNLKKRNLDLWPKKMLENYKWCAKKCPLWKNISILDFSGASKYQKMQHIEPTLDVIESSISYWKESKMKQGIPEDRCSFVYVDWIESITNDFHNVRNAQKNDNEAGLLKKISRELSALARRTRTIIWTACQVKQGSEEKNVLVRKDIAHSSHVIDYCDICIGLALKDAGKIKYMSNTGKKASEMPELSRFMNVSFLKCRDAEAINTYRTFYQGPSLRMWDKRDDMLDAMKLLDDEGIEKFYQMMTGEETNVPVKPEASAAS